MPLAVTDLWLAGSQLQVPDVWRCIAEEWGAAGCSSPGSLVLRHSPVAAAPAKPAMHATLVSICLLLSVHVRGSTGLDSTDLWLDLSSGLQAEQTGKAHGNLLARHGSCPVYRANQCMEMLALTVRHAMNRASCVACAQAFSREQTRVLCRCDLYSE